MRLKSLETFKTEGLASGGCVALRFGFDHPFLQDPRATIVEGGEGVFKTAFPAAQGPSSWIGILACVGVAQIASTGVGHLGGEDGDNGSMDVAMNHGHNVVLESVAVSFPFTSHNHFGADGVRFSGGKCVVAVGLFEASADAMNGDFPEL